MKLCRLVRLREQLPVRRQLMPVHVGEFADLPDPGRKFARQKFKDVPDEGGLAPLTIFDAPGNRSHADTKSRRVTG